MAIQSIRGDGLKLNFTASGGTPQAIPPHWSLVDDTAALKRAVDVLGGIANVRTTRTEGLYRSIELSILLIGARFVTDCL